MKKVLTTATLLTFIAMPAFAQSADPDFGTGNIDPLAATNRVGASAYAQATDTYETGYTSSSVYRSGHTRRHEGKNMEKPGTTGTGNTSVPGASVDKDDTAPKSRLPKGHGGRPPGRPLPIAALLRGAYCFR